MSALLPLCLRRVRALVRCALLAGACGMSCAIAGGTQVDVSARALVQIAATTALATAQDYISRFVLYVRWPDDQSIKAWQVCVASPNTTGDANYKGLTARSRPFAVRHVAANASLAGCQILDLSDADAASTQNFLRLVQATHGILTVGEGKQFCSAGGQICLRTQEQHGGFEVNLSALKGSGLGIKAQLLMFARQTSSAGAGP
ncbi:MAG: YfiR family protein [Rudaea sp.]